MTVGELRELIKDLPDCTPVVLENSAFILDPRPWIEIREIQPPLGTKAVRFIALVIRKTMWF